MRDLKQPLGVSKFDGGPGDKKKTKKTPYQRYMGNPGAVASDTTSPTIITPRGGYYGFGKKRVKAKKATNQTALDVAFKATYGKKGSSGSTLKRVDCTFGTCTSGKTKQFKKEARKLDSRNFDSDARSNYGKKLSKKEKSIVTAPAKKAKLAKSKLAPSGTKKRAAQYKARNWKSDKTTKVKTKK
jgi:hypothetical protein